MVTCLLIWKLVFVIRSTVTSAWQIWIEKNTTLLNLRDAARFPFSTKTIYGGNWILRQARMMTWLVMRSHESIWNDSRNWYRRPHNPLRRTLLIIVTAWHYVLSNSMPEERPDESEGRSKYLSGAQHASDMTTRLRPRAAISEALRIWGYPWRDTRSSWGPRWLDSLVLACNDSRPVGGRWAWMKDLRTLMRGNLVPNLPGKADEAYVSGVGTELWIGISLETHVIWAFQMLHKFIRSRLSLRREEVLKSVE